MSKKSKNKIKFAVGSTTEYFSAPWILWSQKNNVYLAATDQSGTIKLSLHESGRWRFAFTKESGINAQNSEDRVIERYVRPEEFSRGWIQVASVHVPSVNFKKPFKQPYDKHLSRFVWAEKPPADHKIVFTVLYANSTVMEVDFGKILRPGDKILHYFKILNGDSIILSSRIMALTEEEKKFTISVLEQKITYPVEIPKEVYASLFSFGKDELGLHYTFNVPMSWENVFLKEKS